MDLITSATVECVSASHTATKLEAHNSKANKRCEPWETKFNKYFFMKWRKMTVNDKSLSA